MIESKFIKYGTQLLELKIRSENIILTDVVSKYKGFIKYGTLTIPVSYPLAVQLDNLLKLEVNGVVFIAEDELVRVIALLASIEDNIVNDKTSSNETTELTSIGERLTSKEAIDHALNSMYAFLAEELVENVETIDKMSAIDRIGSRLGITSYAALYSSFYIYAKLVYYYFRRDKFTIEDLYAS